MSSKPIREYVLDDGSVWTVPKLMLYLNCAHGTAYHRLGKTDKASYVLRKKEVNKSTSGLRLYVLDDGSEWTSQMVARHTGCKPSTASTRLSCYTDPKKVLKDPKVYERREIAVKEAIKERMYYDPLGHWALLNKAT